ncbi:MAG: hypothetical protein J1F11_04775 [Oscillospiraceae bacterium]|nr:hypothetical protein [Oscillospiraceae bacterium]
MFKIDYKTVPENCLASDRTEDLSSDMAVYCDTVYGDILITVNDSEYGCIYDIPSDEDYGNTVLDHWFGNLIEACIELEQGTQYTIKEPESSAVSMSFKKYGDTDVLVSLIAAEETEWTEKIEYTELANEVINKTGKLIRELCGFNARLAESAVVAGINRKLIELKKELNI